MKTIGVAELKANLSRELRRVASGRLAEILAGLDLVALTDEVKARAKGSFPVVVRTLDALHLSTAELLSQAPDERSEAHAGPERVHFYSFDGGMNRCALAMGFAAPLATAPR
jgi:hypothetical protein